MIDGEIKKVLAIRKKEGPAMGGVPGAIKFCNRDRRSAVDVDAHDRRLCVSGHEDHTVRSPRTSASLRRVTD